LAIDVGEAKDLHPKNKKTVGYRLALHALSLAYKKNVENLNLAFTKWEIRGDSILITFENVGNGLKTIDGSVKVTGFALANSNREFEYAQAYIIDKQTILVRNSNIKKPVALRYAWADN